MRHKRLTCANRSCSMPFLYFLFVFLAPAGLRLVGHWKQEMLLFRKFKDPKSLAHSHTKPHFSPPKPALFPETPSFLPALRMTHSLPNGVGRLLFYGHGRFFGLKLTCWLVGWCFKVIFSTWRYNPAIW